MKIKFLEDKEYCGTVYQSGKIYDIPEENGIALRWIKRGCLQVDDTEVELSLGTTSKKEKSITKGRRRESSQNIL